MNTNIRRAVLLVAFAALPGALYAQSAVTLDQAIGASALQVTNQILANPAMPSAVTVAILNFDAARAAASDYITTMLTIHMLGVPGMTIADRHTLDLIRAELGFGLTGEVSDASAQAIGQFAGAHVVVFGSINRIGNFYLMQTRAIAVETGVILALEFAEVDRRDMRRHFGRQRERPPVRAALGRGLSLTPMTAGHTELGWEYLGLEGFLGLSLISSAPGGLWLNISAHGGGAPYAMAIGGEMYTTSFLYHGGGSIDILLRDRLIIGAGGGMAAAVQTRQQGGEFPFSPYARGSIGLVLTNQSMLALVRQGALAEIPLSVANLFVDYSFEHGARIGLAFRWLWNF